MPEGPGRNSALDRSAQARVGRSVRPPAHVSCGAAEGSGAPFCLHRATEEQPGVCHRLPSLDLVSRDRGARLGRRRLEEPPSGHRRSRDTCVPVCRPYLPPCRNQAQRRGSGDQRGVREAPRPQPFWPRDEDCRTQREAAPDEGQQRSLLPLSHAPLQACPQQGAPKLCVTAPDRGGSCSPFTALGFPAERNQK